MIFKLNIYKLHFSTPLHLGDERDDYSISLKTYHSDAMIAALTSCMAKIGEKIPMNGDLGFTISSLFPFYQKEKQAKAVYFFPKLLKQRLPKLKDLSKAKAVKRVSWLEKSYFEKMIHGETLFDNNQDIEHIQGEFLSTKKIDKEFIFSQVSPRVSVSRDFKEDAKPFYMDRIYFKDYSGLFFIATDENAELLEKALNILQYEGIGTDRNIGNGFFEWTSDIIELNLAESNFISNLSMFCPESESQLKKMLDSDEIAYDFTKRGGWITTSPHNTIRKNSIHMFLPASVFNAGESVSGISIKGKIVDLKPKAEHLKIDHPIWRSGKSIFIPVKI